VLPKSIEALISVIKKAESLGIGYAVIGNATNIIFSDSGFDGAIISTRLINRINMQSKNIICAECGATLPRLSYFAAENSFGGFEGLCSIPATVGGAISLNAGAFGNEISDRLISFKVYIPRKDRVEIRDTLKYQFSYRKSRATDGGAIILSALFEAIPADKSEILQRISKNKEKRRLSQPTGVKSVGSYFKKPDYSVQKDVSPLYYGKSAGELIELCGLKGFSVGGASVSQKHANFLINTDGKASSDDIFLLAETVKRVVLERTGVKLFEEAERLPFSPEQPR
jgi:UDP-N-acetylmuramate dehydrogenase